ncbi:Uncharacterized protein FKW44_023482 [Caligus rogercresseyi]|uniref:Uncharacterized protein n=1 Tax=Caligus rogercresseyi TaxID=217165 RepID=A0A7T8JUS7_CALRO|nr:Uncharacterized protein FKW44_023482 [Caligus rogercresseyi]
MKRLIEDNTRMTTRQVATEDLGLRNVLSVLVPHHLYKTNKWHRVKCCRNLLKLFRDHREDYLSSHLNLCNRYLFQKLKYLLQNDEFGGHEDATLGDQRAMKRVSKDELFDHLRKLRDHCHDVMGVGDNYIY